jgi:hypothetical protein
LSLAAFSNVMSDRMNGVGSGAHARYSERAIAAAYPSRLLKYSPTEAAFLHLRGSRHKVYRIVQFQREFHACSAV